MFNRMVWAIFISINVVSLAYAEPLQFKQVSFKQNYANSIVEGQYPEFFGTNVPINELKRVNFKVKQYARSLFKKFLSYDDTGKAVKNDLVSFKKMSTYSIKFKVARADIKYVSMVFETYIYNDEMVHPVWGIYGFNYDLKNAHVIKLSELFEKKANYLEQIADYCNLDLDRRQIKPSYRKIEGSEIDQFSFSREALSIHFQDFEIADHAEGTPEVKIPLNKLVGLRKDMGL